ncbi:MAG: MmgE/PrpD family protein [Lysobacterales bacterium]|nr:MAG: MmgE/PrpD family protein [Xanthomonadales bacterium]
MTLAEDIGTFAAATSAKALPEAARATITRLIYDVAGLCVAARNADYVAAVRASAVSSGSATAIGHDGGFGPYDAALINGTAAHGEDYDDTFEGGPVHAGAVVVPAVLAAAEHRGLSGDAVVKGIATGVEIMCRMSLVAPQATHKACFHPTAIFGAPAAAVGVAAALGLAPARIANAIGIAGSLASGIIEYLADGSSTKRLHAGAAAQSGIRAALLAENGFTGPATVLEGRHGFYRAFAPSKPPDFAPLMDALGTRWVLETVAFKPYPCGTMTQPFIDCAIELARSNIKAEDIVSMVCEVGEGTVHRLWEPLQQKQAVPNGYAAKFSTPYCIAVGFLDGKAGFEQFTAERVMNPKVRALAATVSYVIDPHNDYPKNFSGHIRATLEDGTVREVRKPHMRGGAHEPLTDGEVKAKFLDNLQFGGWDSRRSAQLSQAIDRIVAGEKIDLSGARS